MKLNEQIYRIKEMMGLIKENDEYPQTYPKYSQGKSKETTKDKNVKYVEDKEKIIDLPEVEITRNKNPKSQEIANKIKKEKSKQKTIRLRKQEQTEGVELTERCWKGYTQKGMKTMFGKKYPNCVKIKK